VPVPVTCLKCGKSASAPDEAAGREVRCPGCGAAVPVPPFPMATPVAPQADRPSAPPDRPLVPLWVRIAAEGVVFVGVCAFFALIGAASNPAEPGLAGSRMARKVGAPLALLLIGAVEVGLWLWRSQQSGGRRP
jgi:hypothetical protein